ncbi:hypothetical protein Q3G72_035440 [Acer saccharum]|nr:hypothetical protein Q3G72_035440 [Acer saccharum]
MYPFYNENLTETPAPAPTPVLRSPPSPGSLTRPKGNNNRLLIIAIVVPIVVSVLLFVLGYCFLAWRARGRKKFNAIPEEIDANDITTVESLQFDFGTIQAATNNFSTNNKLGEGGFGEVYKGILPNGQEIAVKRLSRSSGQALTIFYTTLKNKDNWIGQEDTR